MLMSAYSQLVCVYLTLLLHTNSESISNNDTLVPIFMHITRYELSNQTQWITSNNNELISCTTDLPSLCIYKNNPLLMLFYDHKLYDFFNDAEWDKIDEIADVSGDNNAGTGGRRLLRRRRRRRGGWGKRLLKRLNPINHLKRLNPIRHMRKLRRISKGLRNRVRSHVGRHLKRGRGIFRSLKRRAGRHLRHLRGHWRGGRGRRGGRGVRGVRGRRGRKGGRGVRGRRGRNGRRGRRGRKGSSGVKLFKGLLHGIRIGVIGRRPRRPCHRSRCGGRGRSGAGAMGMGMDPMMGMGGMSMSGMNPMGGGMGGGMNGGGVAQMGQMGQMGQMNGGMNGMQAMNTMNGVGSGGMNFRMDGGPKVVAKVTKDKGDSDSTDEKKKKSKKKKKKAKKKGKKKKKKERRLVEAVGRGTSIMNKCILNMDVWAWMCLRYNYAAADGMISIDYMKINNDYDYDRILYMGNIKTNVWILPDMDVHNKQIYECNDLLLTNGVYSDVYYDEICVEKWKINENDIKILIKNNNAIQDKDNKDLELSLNEETNWNEIYEINSYNQMLCRYMFTHKLCIHVTFDYKLTHIKQINKIFMSQQQPKPI